MHHHSRLIQRSSRCRDAAKRERARAAAVLRARMQRQRVVPVPVSVSIVQRAARSVW